MADVQLEHGHVRIANRLAEAMLYAEFSGVQFKILHALIRLTYGWRRKTVTLSHAELAEYIHAKPSGNFRAALNELIAEGVVVQAKGIGPKHSTYAIEKDYVKWGRFSVSFERLERIYGERPQSDDDAIVQGDLLRDARPKQASYHDRNRRDTSPETGIGTGAKSFIGETCGSGKTVESQGKTSNKERADDVAAAASEGGLELDNFGERRPLVVEFLRSAPSPLARAMGLAAFLPSRGGTDSYETIGVAVQQFQARYRPDEFNAMLFEGVMRKVRVATERQSGRKALELESRHIDREAIDKENAKREEAETERMLAAFQRDHPERFADLERKAAEGARGNPETRAIMIRGALTTLVRRELNMAGAA